MRASMPSAFGVHQRPPPAQTVNASRFGDCVLTIGAAIGRWKQVIGDGLRSRMDERRATEVDVAVYALNRMLELGRPNYVRIA
jgi:hypothetical protein